MSDVPDIANVSRDANGTGPYVLKAFTPDQTVDLVRNDHYFGAKPHFDEIKVVRYADATAAETALRSGNLNVLWSVAPTSAAGLATNGRVLLAATDPAGAFVWEVDTTSPPFNNPKARLALSYAADRGSMMQAGYAGVGVANKSDTIVSPSNKFYNKKLPTDGYDINKAKELFAQAGVHSGDTLTYWTTSGTYAEWTTMGEILQQSLGQIGIKLDIKANELATWSAKNYPKGKKYPGLIAANYISLAPPLPNTYPLEWFSSNGTCECNWVPPARYDADEATIEQQGDTPARTAAFDEMQQILHDQAPVIVIGNTSFLSVVGGNVHGAWVEGEGTLHLEDAGFAA
jgi:peptide/nickel transport system substrate-binding protein